MWRRAGEERGSHMNNACATEGPLAGEDVDLVRAAVLEGSVESARRSGSPRAQGAAMMIEVLVDI